MSTGDQSDFTSRLLRSLPAGWFPSVAPALNAILQAPAVLLAAAYAMLTYARAQTRIGSASGGNLDLISQGYFGGRLPRLQYELDDPFAARIKYNLTAPRGTQDGMTEMLEQLTGNTPAIFRPNNIQQTGGWATQSDPAAGGGAFALYDSSALEGAGIWGSMALPCQVFIIIAFPRTGFATFANQGGFATQGDAAGGGGYGFSTQLNAAAGGGLLSFVDLNSVPGAVTENMIFQQIAEWTPAGYTSWVSISEPPSDFSTDFSSDFI